MIPVRKPILRHTQIVRLSRLLDMLYKPAGIAEELRLELVLDSATEAIEMPQFTGPHALIGNRIVATVPAGLVAEAATWARDLRRTGRIEEFSLSPATLEDAYVALVGSTTGPAISTTVSSEEETDVRAA